MGKKGKTQRYYDTGSTKKGKSNKKKAKKAKAKKAKYDTKYQSSDKQKKRRAARNASRKKAIMNGKISKGSSKDIHHSDGNPENTASSNLKAESKNKNRGRK